MIEHLIDDGRRICHQSDGERQQEKNESFHDRSWIAEIGVGTNQNVPIIQIVVEAADPRVSI